MPPRKLSALCDEEVVREVEDLAVENEVPTEEVLRQLVEVGLEEVESDR